MSCEPGRVVVDVRPGWGQALGVSGPDPEEQPYWWEAPYTPGTEGLLHQKSCQMRAQLLLPQLTLEHAPPGCEEVGPCQHRLEGRVAQVCEPGAVGWTPT